MHGYIYSSCAIKNRHHIRHLKARSHEIIIKLEWFIKFSGNLASSWYILSLISSLFLLSGKKSNSYCLSLVIFFLSALIIFDWLCTASMLKQTNSARASLGDMGGSSAPDFWEVCFCQEQNFSVGHSEKKATTHSAIIFILLF